jgi:hypothetical protein
MLNHQKYNSLSLDKFSIFFLFTISLVTGLSFHEFPSSHVCFTHFHSRWMVYSVQVMMVRTIFVGYTGFETK